MPVARVSIMVVKPFNRKEMDRLQEALEEHLSKLRGFTMGFSFEAIGEKDTLGRVTVWATEDDANRAATENHTVALRAQMHLLQEPGHTDHLVQIIGTPKNLPHALH